MGRMGGGSVDIEVISDVIRHRGVRTFPILPTRKGVTGGGWSYIKLVMSKKKLQGVIIPVSDVTTLQNLLTSTS